MPAGTGHALLYASSAATLRRQRDLPRRAVYEQPLNVYGYSKLLFDNIVRRILPSASTQIAGFRYFNVLRAREQHKGRMASVASTTNNQFLADGRCPLRRIRRLRPGQQSRDSSSSTTSLPSTSVPAAPDQSGIFNLGRPRAAVTTSRWPR